MATFSPYSVCTTWSSNYLMAAATSPTKVLVAASYLMAATSPTKVLVAVGYLMAATSPTKVLVAAWLYPLLCPLPPPSET